MWFLDPPRRTRALIRPLYQDLPKCRLPSGAVSPMNVPVSDPRRKLTDAEPSPSMPESARSPRVSIIVPTFREADNLQPLLTRTTNAMHEAGLTHEIIIVDDDSRDGTEAICRELAGAGHPLRLIVRTSERGLSSAVCLGFTEANGDVLVCLDADLSHPPESIPALVAALADPTTDFVIGSRYVPGGSTEQGWGLVRWLNSRIATLLARPFTAARDPMAGFFALRRSTWASAAPLDPIGYKIGLELIVKCRCRHVVEIPIHFADRHAGKSKLSLKEQFNYLRHLARLARFKLMDAHRRSA